MEREEQKENTKCNRDDALSSLARCELPPIIEAEIKWKKSSIKFNEREPLRIIINILLPHPINQ